MKKLLSVLLILAMALPLSVTAFANETGEENKSLLEKLGSGELFTVKDHRYQIETKTVPLYQGFSDADSTLEIELVLSGRGDERAIWSPWRPRRKCSIAGFLWRKPPKTGKAMDLEIEKSGDIVILTRENQGYPVKINFAENTIEFYDYDAFIKISPDAPLMDVIASSGYDANGEPALFQKSDTSFERFGDPLTLKPGEYGIDLVYQDDEYYVPFAVDQRFHPDELRRAMSYRTWKRYTLCISGDRDYLEDAFYPSVVPEERSDDLIAFQLWGTLPGA